MHSCDIWEEKEEHNTYRRFQKTFFHLIVQDSRYLGDFWDYSMSLESLVVAPGTQFQVKKLLYLNKNCFLFHASRGWLDFKDTPCLPEGSIPDMIRGNTNFMWLPNRRHQMLTWFGLVISRSQFSEPTCTWLLLFSVGPEHMASQTSPRLQWWQSHHLYFSKGSPPRSGSW